MEKLLVKSGPDYYQAIAESNDRVARFIPVEIGKDIFLDKKEALKTLAARLEDAIRGHDLAMMSLGIELAEAKHELEVLEEAGDGNQA